MKFSLFHLKLLVQITTQVDWLKSNLLLKIKCSKTNINMKTEYQQNKVNQFGVGEERIELCWLKVQSMWELKETLKGHTIKDLKELIKVMEKRKLIKQLVIMLMKLTFGVNFINVLRTAFTHADPNSVKRYWQLNWNFTLWGSACVKAVHECWWNWASDWPANGKVRWEKKIDIFYLWRV